MCKKIFLGCVVAPRLLLIGGDMLGSVDAKNTCEIATGRAMKQGATAAAA